MKVCQYTGNKVITKECFKIQTSVSEAIEIVSLVYFLTYLASNAYINFVYKRIVYAKIIYVKCSPFELLNDFYFLIVPKIKN